MTPNRITHYCFLTGGNVKHCCCFVDLNLLFFSFFSALWASVFYYVTYILENESTVPVYPAAKRIKEEKKKHFKGWRNIHFKYEEINYTKYCLGHV